MRSHPPAARPQVSRARRAAAAMAFPSLLLAGAGCAYFGGDDDSGGGGTAGRQGAAGAQVATATLEPRSGSNTRGTATFTEARNGVSVVIEVENAPPGRHAVHLHEVGDCSAPDAMSAGSHFNPDNEPHGAPDDQQHHPGDFGNMTVEQDGKGRLELNTKDLTVKSGKYSVIGKSVIVHEKEDDFSQPVGNAGGRIACGVVKAGG